MDDPTTYQNVLGVFAHYGFRKASMADLADAAGVSRQTLYNRFKNKDQVLDWAVQNFSEIIRQRAEAELSNSEALASARLADAFNRWVGDLVPMLHESPHGFEVMDRGLESLRRAECDPDGMFLAAIANFLLREECCQSQADADDMTFVLVMASKGLLLKTSTYDEFATSMLRVVNVVINK